MIFFSDEKSISLWFTDTQNIMFLKLKNEKKKHLIFFFQASTFYFLFTLHEIRISPYLSVLSFFSATVAEKSLISVIWLALRALRANQSTEWEIQITNVRLRKKIFWKIRKIGKIIKMVENGQIWLIWPKMKKNSWKLLT